MFVVTVFVCNFFVLLVIFIFTLLLVIFVIFTSVVLVYAVIGFGLAFAVFAVFVDIRNAPRWDRRCWLGGILNRYRDGSSRRE